MSQRVGHRSVEPNIVEIMFDSLVAAADGTWGAGGVRAWERVENAAGARRLAATAEVLEARLAADGSAEREQWCLDNWDAVAAAQNVSLGVASHQLMLARALRNRLPRVAEVFAAGEISMRLVNAIVYRTALIQDPDRRRRGPTLEPARGLTMPRRTHTREQNRRQSIDTERRLNDAYVAERNKPPPF
jgi:hypothetical protein